MGLIFAGLHVSTGKGVVLQFVCLFVFFELSPCNLYLKVLQKPLYLYFR